MHTYTFKTVSGGRAKINAGSGFFVPKSNPGIFENSDSVLLNFQNEDDLIIYPANDTVIIDGTTHAAGSWSVTAMSDAINVLFPKVGSGTTTTPNPTNLDQIADTATRLALLPAERTKLGGVQSGATANSSDSSLLSTAATAAASANKAASTITEDSTHRFATDTEKTTWNGKVDAVAGKGLSTEDYTTAEKTKLAGLSSGGATTLFSPQATQTGAKTPAQLNMSVSRRQRTVDPFPTDKFVIYNNDFIGDSPTAFVVNNFSGTTGTTTNTNGNLILTASAGAWNAAVMIPMKPPAPYFFIQCRVSATSGTTASPAIGLYKDANNYISLYVGGGAVGLAIQYNGASFTNTTNLVTSAGLGATAPWEWMIVVCQPEVWAYGRSTAGGDWFVGGKVTLPSTLDFRTDTVRAAWKPWFGANLSSAATCNFDYVRSGIIGGVGTRDYKPVTYKDGTPFTSNNKHYVMATCGTGDDFMTNHTCIMSIDKNTYEAKIESHIFFRVAAGVTSSLYGGTILYDDVNDKWLIITNGWGYGNVSTGIGLWYAETEDDLLSGVHVLDATQLTVNTSFSVYDCAVRYDSAASLWKVAMSETTAAVNWGAIYYTTYWTGTTLNNLTKIAIDNTRIGEGQQWAKIGGTWYILAGSADGWHYYSDTGLHIGLLSTWMNFTGVSVTPSTYWSHPCVIPVNIGLNTKYILLGFDDSKVASGNATKGALFVMEAAEIVAGNEHPRRRVARPSR